MSIKSEIKKTDNKKLMKLYSAAKAQQKPLSRTLPWTIHNQLQIQLIIKGCELEADKRKISLITRRKK